MYMFRYLREVFHNSLPHESTLRKWCANLDASPGFTEQVFIYLKSKEGRMSLAMFRQICCCYILLKITVLARKR